MYFDLTHLTAGQVEELINRYYSGEERVADLLKEYELNINPSKLTSLFPALVHADRFCPYCNTNLVSKRLSKSSGKYNSEKAKCLKCGHIEGKNCRCHNCKERIKLETERIDSLKREAIRSYYTQQDYPDIQIHELELLDAVTLLALARHSLTENFSFCYPFEIDPLPLTPTAELTTKVWRGLFDKKIISIGLDTEVDGLVFTEDYSKLTSIVPSKIDWEVFPGDDDKGAKANFNALEDLASAKISEWPQHWQDSINEVWDLIARHECIENLLVLMDARNFEAEIGEKTHDMFTSLLKSFSVGQVFNLSWSAMRDATDYMVQRNIPRRQATALFLGTIQRKADSAIANQWNIKPSRRDNNHPQTVISSTFFNKFLKIGDKGFTEVASSLAIEKTR